MANTKSAAKSARQATRRRTRNAGVITAIKSQQKKVRKAIAGGDAGAARAEFQKLSSALDKAAKRGVIHRNVADRRKGRLNRALASAKK